MTNKTIELTQTRPITVAELDALDEAWMGLDSSQIRRAAWLTGLAALNALGLQTAAMLLDDDAVLLVEFKSAKGPSYYAYAGVPGLVLDGLVGASSAGRHLNLAVKGRYPFLRLEVEAPE